MWWADPNDRRSVEPARYSYAKMNPIDKNNSTQLGGQTDPDAEITVLDGGAGNGYDTFIERALLAQKNLANNGLVVDGQAMAAYIKDKVRGKLKLRPEIQTFAQWYEQRT
jgi:hypothetical protein